MYIQGKDLGNNGGVLTRKWKEKAHKRGAHVRPPLNYFCKALEQNVAKSSGMGFRFALSLLLSNKGQDTAFCFGGGGRALKNYCNKSHISNHVKVLEFGFLVESFRSLRGYGGPGQNLK